MHNRTKSTTALLLATALFACKTKETTRSVEVAGTIKNASAKMVYLEEDLPNGRPTIMDSAQLKSDGSFRLEAPSKEEALYDLRLGGERRPLAFFISDVPKLTLQADAKDTTQAYSSQGSPASEALVSVTKNIRQRAAAILNARRTYDSLQTAKAPDSVVSAHYLQVDAAVTDSKTEVLDFVRKSKSPVLAVYALSTYLRYMNDINLPGLTTAEVFDAVSSAAARFPAHSGLQTLYKSLAPSKAPDFSQPGVDGNPVSLSSFKGKYVLLDFWASWCRPCRMENPNVVKAFNRFKDKNFTVFSVSLDQQKEAWLQAIQSDGLTWTHASDLQYWNNAAAQLYGVQGIPANFLIDPQGNIVAQNLRGEDLEETLKRLLK